MSVIFVRICIQHQHGTLMSNLKYSAKILIYDEGIVIVRLAN